MGGRSNEKWNGGRTLTISSKKFIRERKKRRTADRGGDCGLQRIFIWVGRDWGKLLIEVVHLRGSEVTGERGVKIFRTKRVYQNPDQDHLFPLMLRGSYLQKVTGESSYSKDKWIYTWKGVDGEKQASPPPVLFSISPLGPLGFAWVEWDKVLLRDISWDCNFSQLIFINKMWVCLHRAFSVCLYTRCILIWVTSSGKCTAKDTTS